MTAALRAWLAAGEDGDRLGLFATAAGVEAAVARTARALDAGALARGPGGPAGTPATVAARVDALAASGVDALRAVADGWPRPAEVGPGDALVRAAWLAGARFVAVTEADLATPDPELRAELAVHVGPLDDGPRTWRDLVAWLGRRGGAPWRDVRALDRRALDLGVVTAAMLDELLAAGTDGTPALARLRVLRGREGHLDPAAVRALVARVRGVAAAGPAALATPAFCIAAEVALARAPELHAELADALVAALDLGVERRRLAPLVYALVGRGWRTP